jgi:uncharacterized protein (TIGR02246 family)
VTRWFLAVAAAVLALGAAWAQPNDMDEIRSVSQQWADLYNAGDIAALADLYLEDAVLYGNTGQVLAGRAAIQAALQAAHDSAPGAMTRQSLNETEVLGDTAYDIGTYTVTDASGAVLARGYFLTVLKRTEGGWRIYRQIDNLEPSPS